MQRSFLEAKLHDEFPRGLILTSPNGVQSARVFGGVDFGGLARGGDEPERQWHVESD